jgi:hypothetical protein
VNHHHLRVIRLLAFAAPLLWTAAEAAARPVRGTTRTSVNRNFNVNRNIDVNRNVNVHRDIDVDIDRGYYHPVARAAAATTAVAATAVAVGTVVNALPASCTMVTAGGVTYQRCGSTYYQPRYYGTQVSYVAVNPPG